MKKILIMTVALLLVSCGKSSSNEKSETSAYGASEGKLCNTEIINGYNELLSICNIEEKDSSVFRERVMACIESADTLTSKYPNANCTASRTRDNKDFNLTTSDFRNAQSGYTAENYLNYKDGKSCGKFFLQDYASIYNHCSDFDFSEIAEVYECKSYVDKIVTKYPNYNCTFKSDSGDTESVNSEELIQVQTTLDGILKQMN